MKRVSNIIVFLKKLTPRSTSPSQNGTSIRIIKKVPESTLGIGAIIVFFTGHFDSSTLKSLRTRDTGRYDDDTNNMKTRLTVSKARCRVSECYTYNDGTGSHTLSVSLSLRDYEFHNCWRYDKNQKKRAERE